MPTRLVLGLAFALALLAVPPLASAKEAVDFTLKDVDGTSHRLSQYRGRWVVLEWINPACPSVKALYAAKTVPSLQSTWKQQGLVWLTINSTGAGQRGHMSAAQNKAALAALGGTPTAYLLDPTGTVGKAFQAQVTPEVRLLSPKGDVVYAGGIESAGPGAREGYLDTVLKAIKARQAVPYAAKPARGTTIAYVGAAAAPATTAKATGPKAPDFALRDSYGFTRRLSDYKGKWVILEWVNYDCPFVKKHYHSSHRSMQLLQQRAKRYGIVWLSICSSAPGKEGSLSPTQANARMTQMGAKPTAYLHDPDGTVGRAYRAMTTPDMRVISPQGTIEYSGGIDDIRSMRAADAPRAKNYIRLAIADIVNGKAIAIRSSRPYGCSVKY